MRLAVLNKFQGQGVGRELMATAEQWAKDIGAEGVRFNSGKDHFMAHTFYEKIGYDEAKTQVKFQKLFQKLFQKVRYRITVLVYSLLEVFDNQSALGILSKFKLTEAV